jgi:putative membrane protein
MTAVVDHARVTAAIKAAETTTSGEIYCVLARSSDGYFYPAAFFVACTMLVVSLAVALGLEYRWHDVPASTFVTAQVLALGAGLVVLAVFPGLRIRLVPKRLRYGKAHGNAARQFLSRNIHTTEARTGVLVFVSLAERYAEIVADAGINARVPQQEWNRIVAELTQAAAEGRLTEGFEGAVAAAGTLLSQHFPYRPHDRNELDDKLVEI